MLAMLPLLKGRGQPAVRFGGNVNFRNLCCEKQAEYSSMQRHAQKDSIAREIVDEIKRRGGRFLRRCELKQHKVAAVSSVTCSEPEWIEIEDNDAIEKAKQTMRDTRRQPSDSISTRKDNTERSTSLPPIPVASSQHQSQQLCASRRLSGPCPAVQTEMDSTLNIFAESILGIGGTQLEARDRMSETALVILAAWQRSLSLPSIALQQPLCGLLQRFYEDLLDKHPDIDVARLLDRHGLPQMGRFPHVTYPPPLMGGVFNKSLLFSRYTVRK